MALRESFKERVLLDQEGSWKLISGHEVVWTLRQTAKPGQQRLSLRGVLVEAKANALVVALHQREDERLGIAKRLTLQGRWQADTNNRLTFLVDKGEGLEDRLTLQGGWEVGPHHELLYRYRRLDRVTRAAEEHTLIFDGSWDITRADRLVYRLAGSQDSSFEFTASLQSPSLLARDRQIVYQVGIGLSEGRRQRQRVMLFGTWKLNRDRSVSFEIPYAEGRVQAIRFEGMYAPSRRDRIAIALHNDRHEALGLTVTFTRDVLKDTRLFLRLQKGAEESSAIAGVQVRF